MIRQRAAASLRHVQAAARDLAGSGMLVPLHSDFDRLTVSRLQVG
jgi:hypothetical protein